MHTADSELDNQQKFTATLAQISGALRVLDFELVLVLLLGEQYCTPAAYWSTDKKKPIFGPISTARLVGLDMLLQMWLFVVKFSLLVSNSGQTLSREQFGLNEVIFL